MFINVSFILKIRSQRLFEAVGYLKKYMAFSEVLDSVIAFCDFILVTMVKHTFCDIYQWQ
jgi:hypothetical protein